MTRAIPVVSSSKKRLTLAGVLVVMLAAALGALAYFTTTGTGSGTASAGTLSSPSITSATPGAGTVALTWSTVTPPGSPAATYYVQRDGGTPAGNCPTSGSPTGVLTCTDSGLSAGTYSYTVTAKWRTWTATSASSSATVASGAITHFTLTAATTTPTAGQANDLTVTAKDAANVTVTTYTGAHSLTFGGASTIGAFNPTVTDKDGNAVSFGTATPITFSSGVATVSGSNNGVMKLYKVESPTITVTDGSVSNTGLNVTVSAASAAAIALTGSIADLASGAPRMFTATVRDSYGNTVTTGADSTVSINFAQTGGAGSVSGTGSSAASGGVATKSLTGVLAGSVDLQASATLSGPGSTSSNTLTLNVVGGTATQLVFTTPARTITAAGAVSSAITLERRDANNNPTTSGGNLVVGLASNTSGTGTFRNDIDTATITSVTIASGTSSASFAYKDTVAGSWTITATSTLPTVTQGITVNAATGSLVARATGQWNAASTWSAVKTGTITTTTSSATVTGSGTLFTTEVRVGDTIFQNNGTTVVGVVQSITSNTSLTLTANAAVALGGTTYFVGRIPLATDNVSVLGAFTVTIPSGYAAVANTITLGATNANSVIALAASSSSLAVGGNVSITGPTGGATRDLQVNDGTLSIGGNLSLGDGQTGNNANRVANVTVTTGTVTVNGNVTFNNIAGSAAAQTTIDMSGGGGTFNLGGTFTINNSSGTFTPSATSTFSLFGGAAQTIPVGVSSVNYNNITVNNTSASGVTFSAGSTGSADISGDITIASGSTLNSGNFNHIFSGSLTNNGTFNVGTSSITFAGTTPRTIGGTSTTTFNNLTINSTSTVTLNASQSVAGDLTVSSGTFDLGSNTIDRTASGGTLSVSGGTLKIGGTNGLPANYTTHTFATAGTVEYAGSSQVVSAESYGGLTLSGSGVKTAAGDLSVTGNFANNGVTFAAPTTVTVNGSGAQSIGGSSSTTFNSLTIDKSGGTATLGVNESVAGNLFVSAGTLNLSTFTINRNASGGTLSLGAGAALLIGGSNSFPANYATHTLNATSTMNYNGTGAQSVSAESYGNLAISGAHTTNSVTLASSGTIGVAGTFSPTATFTSGAYVTTGSTVDFNGSGAQTVPAFNYNNLTVSGARTTSNVTLVNGGTIGVAGAFSPTATFTTGNYVVTGNTVNFNGSGSQTIPAFNYNNLTSSSTGGRTLASGGTIKIAGTFTQGTNAYTVTGSTVDFNGSAAQTVPLALTPSYNNVSLDNASGATLGTAITASNVTGNVTVGSGTFDNGGNAIAGNGGATFQVAAGATFKLSGTTSAFPTGFGTVTLNATSTVNYAGSGAQTVIAQNYGNLTSSSTGARTLAGSGTVGIAGTFTQGTNTFTVTGSTVDFNGSGAQPVSGFVYNNVKTSVGGTKTAAAALTVGGSLTIGASTILATANNNIALAGDWTNNGSFTAGTSTVTFNGSSTQTLTGATTFSGFTVNSSGLTLASTQTVGGTLTFTSGIVTTGANTLIANGAVSRTSGHVFGNLQKPIATGSNVAATFEVGGATNYRPVSVTFASVTAAGNLTVSETTGQHPNIATSGLNSSRDVNAYWTLTKGGALAFTTFSPTFNFVAGDVLGGANTSNFIVKRWDTSAWNTTTTGTQAATSTQATGVSTLGTGGSSDFAIGEPPPTKLAITSVNGGSSVTSGSPFSVVVQAQDANGNPGSVSSATGISLSVGTGVGTLGGTVTGTIPAGSSQVTISGVTYTNAFGESGVVLTASRTSGDSLTLGNSSSFTVLGSPSRLAFVQQPTDVIGGEVISPAVTVEVEDANGSRVTSSSAAVTIAIGTNPGGATLAGTLTQNAVNGLATFNGLSLNKVASGYALTASSGVLTSVTNSTFSVVAGNCSWNAGSGNWSTVASWTCDGSGSRVPRATDNVTISRNANVTVTVDVSAVAYSLSLGTNANNQPNTLTLSGTNSLNVTTDVTLNRPGGGSTTALNVNAGSLTVGGGVTYAGATGAGRIAKIAITSGTATVAGNVTFSTGAANADNVVDLGTSSTGGTLNIGGSFVFTANFATLTTGTNFTVNYNGTSAQTVGAFPAGSYDNLVLSGASTKTAGGNLAIAGDVTIGSGATFAGATFSHTVSGNWANNGGTFSGGTSTVTFSGTTQAIGGTTLTAFAALVIDSGAAVTMNNDNSASSLSFTASATASSLTQANGTTLTVNGAVTLSQPTASFTTAWNINTATGTVSGLITFAGANTTAARVAKIVTTTGTLNANGGLTFTASAAATKVIDMSGGAGNLNLKGALTVPAASSTLTAGTAGSNFNYADTNAQTVNVFSAGAYNNLVINNTNASGAALGAAITAANVTGNVTVGSGTFNTSTFAIAGNAGKTFAVAANATFIVGGTTTAFPTGFGTVTLDAASTVNYAGTGAQTIAAQNYGNLTISGARTTNSVTLVNGGTIGIAGTFSTTATFTSGGYVTTGNTVNFNGTGAQTVPAFTFNNLTISNAAGVSLGGNATVGGTLALGANIVTTGANKVIANGTVTSSTGFVNGNLQRAFAAGASTVVFDVGSGSTYAPISITVAGANAGGTLIGSTTGSQHANYATSGLSATKYVNRYWTLTAGTLTVTGYNATFTFIAGDLIGSPNTATLLVKRWNGSTWNAPTTSSSTSTTVTGTTFGTAFGDYASGN